MTWLLRFIPSSARLYAIGAAILAGLFAILRLVSVLKQSGVDAQKAKEAQARERDLERIKAAAGAKPIGGVSDDPRNLDR